MRHTVLYINPTSVHGGAEEALLQLMECAQALDFQPVLVVPKPGWLTTECKRRGIPCELLPSLPDAFRSDTFRAQISPLLINAIAISQLVRKWQAVLVHSNTPRASYHGGMGARLAQVPAVTHVHDIVGLPYSRKSKAWLLSSIADYTLVPSNAVKEVVSSMAPQVRQHIETLYYGWNTDRYKDVLPADLSRLFGIPSNIITIGTVAAMTPWKGQDILIEAFRTIHSAKPDTRLLIIGGSQGGKLQTAFEAQLRQKALDTGLGNAIIFTGWREDVWSLIRALDLFAHIPTQPDPLPTAVLHACALGSTIIASRTGGIPEIVQDQQSGWLVPPSSAEAVSNAIIQLISNPIRRKALKQRARDRFIEQFNQSRMIDGLSNVYSQVLR